MASSIDPTKPVRGTPTTRSVRDNFKAAKEEIEALQAGTSITSIDLGTTTVTGTTAQFNAALSDDDFATLTNTVTLTNKTLTNPVLDGYTDFQEISEPSSPSADTARVFAEDEGGFSTLRWKDSSGLDHELTRDTIHVVRNNSGGQLSAGEVVYLTGSQGSHPTVDKAKADSNSTMPAYGIVVADIADSSFGQVIQAGDLTGIDTSAFTGGAELYVSASTAGALTETAPTGTDLPQRVASVVNSGSGGSGILNVTIGTVNDPGLTQTLTNTTFDLDSNTLTGTKAEWNTAAQSDTFVFFSDYNANTLLAADTNNTPTARTISEQEVVGRLTGGNIAGLPIGIADDDMVQVDGSPNDDEYARFTANGLEGRTEAEFKADFNLEIGTDVQAHDAGLDDISGLAVTDGNFIVGDGNNWVAESGATARASMSAQEQGDVLDDLNTLGAATADGEFIVATGAGAFQYESGSTARDSLELGASDGPQFFNIELGHPSDTTLARASAGDMNINGNIAYRAGGTDVPIADGGTGSSTASDARTALDVPGLSEANTFAGSLVVEVDGAISSHTLTGYRDSAFPTAVICQGARGSKASPSASQVNDNLFQFAARGWTGSEFSNAAVFLGRLDDTDAGGNGHPSVSWIFRTRESSSSAGSQGQVRAVFAHDGEKYFPGISTTGDSANAVLDSASSPTEQLLRSTSSLRYKEDIEPLEIQRGDEFLDRAKPIWFRSKGKFDVLPDGTLKTFYSFAAEDLAEIDSRLARWGYLPEDYEQVKTGEVEEQTDEAIGEDENGDPIYRTVTVPVYDPQLKEGAELKPDGINTNAVIAMLTSALQEERKARKELEARVAKLETSK